MTVFAAPLVGRMSGHEEVEDEQLVLPSTLVFPTAHAKQSAAASCAPAVTAASALYVFTAQFVQAVAVVVVEYLPAAQIEQLEPDTNCPAAQVTAVQVALPSTLVFPTAHAKQSAKASCAPAVKAASALYVFAVQAVQDMAPVEAT